MDYKSISNVSSENLDHYEQDGLLLECPDDEPYTLLTHYTRTTLYVVAMVISLLGNSAVILIVRKNRRMRTLMHHLIVNMAVADLLITIFHMPYKLKVQLTNGALVPRGFMGAIICKLVGYTQDVSIASSVLSLMVISIDRFMAVLFPLKSVTLLHRPCCIIIPLWITSFVMCSPLLYANRMNKLDFYCYEEWSAFFMDGQDYTIIQFTLLYALPLTVITVLYSCIMYRIWNRRIPGHAAPHLRHVRSHSIAKKRLLKMLIIIVCLFAACWLPYHIIFFLQFTSDESLYCSVTDTVVFYCLLVGHVNSAINPCIYFALHKEYRKSLLHIRRLICCQLEDLTVVRCPFRRFSSFNLQSAQDPTEYPSSFPEVLNRGQRLGRNQVVVTKNSAMTLDYAV